QGSEASVHLTGWPIHRRGNVTLKRKHGFLQPAELIRQRVYPVSVRYHATANLPSTQADHRSNGDGNQHFHQGKTGLTCGGGPMRAGEHHFSPRNADSVCTGKGSPCSPAYFATVTSTRLIDGSAVP